MGIGSTESRRALLALTTLAAVTLLVGRGPSAIRTPQSSFLLLRRLDSPRPFFLLLLAGGAAGGA